MNHRSCLLGLLYVSFFLILGCQMTVESGERWRIRELITPDPHGQGLHFLVIKPPGSWRWQRGQYIVDHWQPLRNDECVVVGGPAPSTDDEYGPEVFLTCNGRPPRPVWRLPDPWEYVWKKDGLYLPTEPGGFVAGELIVRFDGLLKKYELEEKNGVPNPGPGQPGMGFE